MTQIIHNFFADGRADALAEVRILRHQGLWTKQKRAEGLKEAVACYERLYHTHASLTQGRSYYAGRIAALKSRRTAHFTTEEERPALPKGVIIYHPLPVNETHTCSLTDCGSEAAWSVSFQIDGPMCLVLCDCCKQEWVRAETAYTMADGWDWDENDDEEGQSSLLLPVALCSPERRETFLALSQRVLPLAFFLGFDVSNFFYPVSQSTMFDELFTVVLVALLCKPLLRLCLYVLMMEGEDA